MTTANSVPVTIDPEAAELVAELGMQAELDRMLEHARQAIPGLLRLEVVFAPPYDTGPDPSVVIDAYRDAAARPPYDQVRNEYTRWEIETFLPDVLRHFTLLIWDATKHGR